mgnify:CR=1 FL=1|tara:strand:- start:1438 stop:2151 length:714 start_codon:yes stop_codon:yes gene_type:complete
MQAPNYYSILTAEVRYDKDLTPNAKLLYSEITALTNKSGVCWASNSYFSELYDVSKVTISRWVSKLAEKGYICVKLTYKDNTKQIEKRIISLPINKNDNTPIQNSLDPINKIDNTPINKIVNVNTTSNNTTSNNKRVGKPTNALEVENYLRSKGLSIDEAINFYEYYESNGWKVGKNPMKNWKMAVNRWVRNARPKKNVNPNGLAAEYFGSSLASSFDSSTPAKSIGTNSSEIKYLE